MGELDAGRTLDYAVAVKVFGHNVAQERRPNGEMWIVGASFAAKTPVPPYSTEVEAAFNVIRRMEIWGWFIGLDLDHLFWYARFNRPNGVAAYDTAVTAPLAICRAALRAMEVANG